jgi:two-component system sensor histidine kinase SenX3
MLNLLSNAVKYSEDERWIAVRVFRRGPEVGLEVEDHGIGIDPAEQERIFDDFYRVDQRLSSARQGVGLGLTLVRRIVGAHHGRVTVDSARHRGSRFTVWLPVEPAGTGAAPPQAGGIPQEA